MHYVRAGMASVKAFFLGASQTQSLGALAVPRTPQLISSSEAHTAQYALYCLDGMHRGEILFLNSRTTCIGPHCDASIVVTPQDPKDRSVYGLELNRSPALRSLSGSFVLNGQARIEAELFDYDELEIVGNRFLVLDLYQSDIFQTDNGTKQ